MLQPLMAQSFCESGMECWHSDNRPTTPNPGKFGYNITTNMYEFFNGSSWVTLTSDISHVPNNTALKTLAGAGNTIVFRDGFASPGDGGAANYIWSSSACSLNGGLGDNGYQVKPDDNNGCWTAIIGPETNIAVWGALGQTAGNGDTPTLVAAGNAIGTFGLKTVLTCNGVVNLVQATITAANFQIDGKNQCNFNANSNATTSNSSINYTGPGPLIIERVLFTAPIYSPTNWAAVPVQKFLRIGSTTGPISYVRFKHLRCIGGQSCMLLSGVNEVDIEDIFVDRAQGTAAINIEAAADSVGNVGQSFASTRHVRINNVRCRAIGGECISAIDNITSVSTTLSELGFDIRDVRATLGGFISGKFCFTFSGTGVSRVKIETFSYNCFSGGTEIKFIPIGGLVTPNYYSGIEAQSTYISNFDQGVGMNPNWETKGAIANLYNLNTFESNTTFLQPGAWQASTRYEIGDIVTNGGKTFGVLADGTSGVVGPTSATCNGTVGGVVTEGTISWLCLQSTPSASAVLTSMVIAGMQNAVLKIDAQDTAGALAIIPEGNPAATISNLDVYLNAHVNQNCLKDFASGDATIKVWTIDSVRLINPNCIAGRSDGLTASTVGIQIGFGNATGFSNSWTNFQIIGGTIQHVGVTTGSSGYGTAIVCSNTGATVPPTVDLTIIGTRLLGGNGAFSLTDCNWTIKQIGGTVETTRTVGSPGLAPINITGAGSTGSYVTVGPVGVLNGSNATRATWAVGGGATMTVSGKFIAPPSATFPTAACNWGDVVPIDPNTTADGNWICALPGVGGLNWMGGIQTVGVTATQIPACSAALTGLTTYVTDQNTAVAYHGAVTAGGAIKQRIMCDATNWLQD